MTPTSAPEASRQCGFTLLELLVVLGIIAVALGLIVPNLGVTENARFNAEIRKAINALNHARRMAIVEAAPTLAEFYSVDEPVYAATLLPAERRVIWHNPGLQLGFQNEVESEPEPSTQVLLSFFPQGGSSGGILSFSDEERRARVRVDPITGRIAVAYDDEAFDEAF